MSQIPVPENSSATVGPDPNADASLARLVAQLFGAVSNYAEVRRDRLWLQIRLYLFVAAASFVGLTVFAGLAVAAALLILTGIAGGIAEWLNGRWWTASILTGAGFFVVAGTTLWVGSRTIRARQVRLLRHKYETRRNERRRCAE